MLQCADFCRNEGGNPADGRTPILRYHLQSAQLPVNGLFWL